MKARINVEFQRRAYTNSLAAQYNTRPYTVTPAQDVKSLTEHYQKIIDDINVVLTSGLSAQTTITGAGMNAIAAVIGGIEAANVKVRSTTCSSGCSGTCSTACFSSCISTNQ